MSGIRCPDCGSDRLEVSEGISLNQSVVVCYVCGSLFLVKIKEK